MRNPGSHPRSSKIWPPFCVIHKVLIFCWYTVFWVPCYMWKFRSWKGSRGMIMNTYITQLLLCSEPREVPSTPCSPFAASTAISRQSISARRVYWRNLSRRNFWRLKFFKIQILDKIWDRSYIDDFSIWECLYKAYSLGGVLTAQFTDLSILRHVTQNPKVSKSGCQYFPQRIFFA